MTIIATSPFYQSGALVAAGSTLLNYAADVEADLVRRRVASYVGGGPDDAGLGRSKMEVSINPTSGQLERWDAASGAYVGVGGGPLVPAGLDWLTDTISGFDIYERGFVKRPTIFFDPSAASSLGRGTFANPYTTQAQLQAAIAGDMSGQVLGFKRGTTLQVTGTNGLNLTCHGTAADPFSIVPYGDAEALPIISAHTVPTWVAVSGGIYKYAIGASESDIWQNGVRVWKLNPTNAATNNDTGTTVTNEATALTALAAKGAGWSVYISNTLYFYPYDGEDPNLGQCYVPGSSFAFLLQYSDIAASGFIEVAGLDVRYARSSAFSIAAAAKTTISTIGGIQVVGCRVGKAGVDSNTVSGVAHDGLIIYGASEAQRISSLYVAGNEFYDVLNNGFECAGLNGGTAKDVVVEYNYGHDVGGNSIAEVWSSSSNMKIRYNYGDRSSTYNRNNTGARKAGIWVANYYENGAGNWAVESTANTHNVNIEIYDNLILNPGSRGIDVGGGSGHTAYHNTIVADSTSSVYAGNAANSGIQYFNLATGTNAAALGFVTLSNNICAAINVSGTGLRHSFVYCQNATGGIPAGDNNIYYQDAANTSANWSYWRAPGASKFAFTGASSWLEYTAASAAGMDAASQCSAGITGGALTNAGVAFSSTDYNVSAASTIAGDGKASLGLPGRYRLGNPRIDATPTAGSEGTA